MHEPPNKVARTAPHGLSEMKVSCHEEPVKLLEGGNVSENRDRIRAALMAALPSSNPGVIPLRTGTSVSSSEMNRLIRTSHATLMRGELTPEENPTTTSTTNTNSKSNSTFVNNDAANARKRLIAARRRRNDKVATAAKTAQQGLILGSTRKRSRLSAFGMNHQQRLVATRG